MGQFNDVLAKAESEKRAVIASRLLCQRPGVPQAFCYDCDETFYFVEDIAMHLRLHPGCHVRNTEDGKRIEF